ncbi:AAA domain-containing protein [Winogradskyella sp.]|uniref:AAA domain-containing protein n=1 Tax=Winogradskyella sp. TaxID=1883156 RepID=UPI003AB445F2
MGINQESHIRFYETEIETITKKWRIFLSKRVNILIAEKKLFIARLLSFDEKTGHFIVRFRSDEVPRQFTQYFMGLIGPKAISYGEPALWNFTYKEFRNSKDNGLWGNRLGGEIITNRCFRVEGIWSYFKLTLNEQITANGLKKLLSEKKDLLVLITESDPLIQYLVNLQDYIIENPKDSILNFNVDYDIKKWKPSLVDNEQDILDKIFNWTRQNDITIIQGPPGTGKSFNAALLTDRLLKLGQSVCICSLANKALIEIVNQDGLQNSLNDGKIYKTNLTDEEMIEVPQLNQFDSDLPEQGKLLLTTYYKLSEIGQKLHKKKRRYDLIIIEEASQAFLATIAMFRSIAKKLLIIGDHMQLAPVVITNEDKLLKIDENIFRVINGMSTICSNNERQSFRLTKTRRLTEVASKQTGVFYNRTLSSISPLNNKVLHNIKIDKYFDLKGGVSLLKLPAGHTDYSMLFVKKLITGISRDILSQVDKSVAILVQTRLLEIELTQALVKTKVNTEKIIISTVHKIQGITVDYGIVYLPLKNANLELTENFFNVATSRAKRGTLIITYKETLDLAVDISPLVKDFLNQCKIVNLNNI